MMRRAAVALVTATTLATTACGIAGGGSDSTGSLDGVGALVADAKTAGAAPTATSAGVCLAGARLRDNPDGLSTALSRYGMDAFESLGDDPAWTDPVDCSEPHEIEVYGIVSLPAAIDGAVGSYADLVTPGTRVYRAVEDEVTRGCAVAFDPAAAASRGAPLSIDVIPFWSQDAGVAIAWAPSPAAAWDQGEHTFACLFEQSHPDTVRLADVSTADFPVTGRVCLRGTAFVSCGQRHDAERIATIRLDRAVDQGQVAGARAVDDAGRVDIGVDAWRALDGVCQRYLDAVAPDHDPGLRGVANTYPELYPDPDGHYAVMCSAQAPFGSSPSRAVVTAGSVFAAP
jgi:hypothetical protein